MAHRRTTTSLLAIAMLGFACGIAAPGSARAQTPAPPIEFSADSVTANTGAGTLTGRGNVVVQQGDAELTADRVDYDRATGRATATGNATLTRDKTQLEADSLTYDGRTNDAEAKGNVSGIDAGADGGAVEFSADSVIVNDAAGTLTAEGNVVIRQGGAELKADRVEYDRNTGRATATGNVVFTDADGGVHKLQSLMLEEEFSRAFAENTISRLGDGTWLSADALEYEKDSGGSFTASRFTPCDCDFEGGETPTWELRTGETRHDTKARTIYHTNVRMRLFSVPVMYFPYLWHPDPTVRRQSGLLPPRISLSSDLGATIAQPLYLVTGDTHDVQITPNFFSNEGEAVETNYRRYWDNSELHARLVGGRLNTFRKKRENVLGVDATFTTTLFNDWKTTARLYRTSQDTFMRRYNFDQTEELKSHITAERVKGDTYSLIESYGMQDLKAGSNSQREPVVLPQFFHERTLSSARDDFALRMRLSATALNNDDFTDLRRVTSEFYGIKEYATNLGIISGEARLSAQYRDILTATGNRGYTGQLGQGSASAGIGWAVPLARRIAGRHIVLEPRAKFVSVRATDRTGKVPNRDSADFRLDEANLFLLHREQGEDYAISHSRVDGGVAVSLFDPLLGDVSGFLGSSVRVSGEASRGLNAVADGDRFSDVLTTLAIRPNEKLNFSWAGRFHPRELILNESRARAEMNFDATKLDFTYRQLGEAFFNEADEEQEDLIVKVTQKLTDDWSVSWRQEYDLTERRRRLEDSSVIFRFTGGLQDCLTVDIGYRRDGTLDRDIRPIDEVFVVFNFKNLGSVTTSDNRGR